MIQKVIYIFVFYLLSLFFYGNISFALQYNGLDSLVFPNILDSFGRTVSTPVYNGTSSVVVANQISGLQQYSYSQLGCFNYRSNFSSGNLALSGVVFQFMPTWENQSTANLPSFLSAPVSVYAIPQSDNSTLISLSILRYPASLGYYDIDMMYVPTYPNSQGGDTSIGVFCVSPSFWLLPRYQSGEGVYLHSVRFSYYQGSTGVFGYDSRFFTGFGVYGLKIADFSTMPLSSQDPNSAWHSWNIPYLNKNNSTSTGTLVSYSSSSGSSFVSNITGGNIDNFLSSLLPDSISTCVPFVNGLGDYVGKCFSSVAPLTHTTAGMCYKLKEPYTGNQTTLITDTRNVIWLEISCNPVYPNISLPNWFDSSYSSTGNLLIPPDSTDSGSTTCSTFDFSCVLSQSFSVVFYPFTSFINNISELNNIFSSSGRIVYLSGSFSTNSYDPLDYNDYISNTGSYMTEHYCQLSGLYFDYDNVFDNFTVIRSDLSYLDSVFNFVQRPFKILISPIVAITSIFSNAIAPLDNTRVCLLGVQYTVKYQSMFFPNGSSPQIISALQGYSMTPGQMTIFDYLLLSFVGISSMSVILYYLNLSSS